MKAHITKYALTKGIIEMDVVESPNFQDMVSERSNRLRHFHGMDWHLSKMQAIEKAEEMRSKKIASLEKQIEKLKKLKFEV